MNSIELSYRAELRDLFDAHFGRFEEKLERRFSETKEELRRDVSSLRAELHDELAPLKETVTSIGADLQSVNEKLALLKWNFAVWVPVTLAVIGLYFKS